jgi:prophage antirepressor-like protein
MNYTMQRKTKNNVEESDEEVLSESQQYITVAGKEITDSDLIVKILLKLRQIVTDDEFDVVESSLNAINDNEPLNEEDTELTEIIKKYEADIIQTILDNNVRTYRKYTQKNPMLHVTYNDTLKKYRLTTGKQETKETIEEIRDLALNVSTSLSGNSVPHFFKNYFEYGKKYFLCYWHEGDPYFDIRHIVSVLNLEKSTENKIMSKHPISMTVLDINEFGGYIQREIIEEEIMYTIILNSNSSFAKTFKKSVTKILIELRKRNGFEIKNNDMVIRQKILDDGPMQFTEINKPYVCNNKEHMAEIKNAVNEGKRIKISNYAKRHVLYAVLLFIGTLDKKTIIKFGYSEDIATRMTSLPTEYGTEVCLLKIKEIHGQSDERHFHTLIKSKYANLICNATRCGKEKTELYYFNRVLMEEFEDYMSNNGQNNIVALRDNRPGINVYEKLIEMQQDKIIEYEKIIREQQNELETMKKEFSTLDDVYLRLGTIINRGNNDNVKLLTMGINETCEDWMMEAISDKSPCPKAKKKRESKSRKRKPVMML